VTKIEAIGVRKEFQGVSGQRTVAVDDLSFGIDEGECVCIVGRTGCGKSTLLSMMLGLEAPSQGRLVIDGRSPHDDFVHFRGRIAAVFQTDRLLPWRNAIDNARTGLQILGVPAAEQVKRAEHWLDNLGLGRFKQAYPHELSGGMRQRVALARAFSLDPDVLLLDEAFGHLDEVTAARLRLDFVSVLKQVRKTCVIVTHNIDEAIQTASRILVLGRPARILLDAKVRPDDREGSPAERLRERIFALIEGSSEH
jgi:NitT/TauT family transport system ATP-binding protein